MSRPTLRPTQTVVQQVLGLYWGVKQPEQVLITHLLLVPVANGLQPYLHLHFVPALACHEVTFTFISVYVSLYFFSLISLLCLVRMHLCCCFFPYEMCSGRMYVWFFLCYSLSLLLIFVVYIFCPDFFLCHKVLIKFGPVVTL